MKRMTAEEVADKLERLVTVWRSVNVDRSIAHKEAACYVRDNLIPQWQDEPDEEGEYHVRGIDQVCYVSDDIVWRPTWDKESESARIIEEPLNGRQVCPIGERPQ